MENASKALLMAAGVLIGIAILSLAVYLYASFGGTAETIQKQIEAGQLDQFNNQFLTYEKDSGECTIYDILSVINLANECNYKYDYEEGSDYYITVKVGNKNVNNVKQLDKLIAIIDDNVESEYSNNTIDENKSILYKYSCNITYNDLTGRVNEIQFMKITS